MKTYPKARRHSSFNLDVFSNEIARLLDSDHEIQTINPGVWNILRDAQKAAFKKKFRSPSSKGEESRAAALDLFYSINSRLAGFDLALPTEPINYGSSELPCLRTRQLEKARLFISQILGEFDSNEFFSECKHGPNSSLGVKFNDSGNSAKWKFPLTVTEGCVGLFEIYLKWDHTLVRALQGANPDCSIPANIRAHLKVVNWSRLTTVPKNDLIDRTIAIEPTLNMFFQQGLGSYIASKLVAFGVDISTQQDLHKHLAWEASLTRKLATIDFSSASDCVSTTLVRYLLPPVWFNFVDRLRTENVLGLDGALTPVSCIATMGNSTTFVLETLIFFALAAAIVDSQNTNPRSRFVEYESYRAVSVFGDDCIVPAKVARSFCDLCKSVGFLVNDDKSFMETTDPFRESCGADFLSGYNVRPFYLKAPRSCKPSVIRAWLYSVWNGLSKRLILSLGVRNYAYSQVLQYVASVIASENDEIFFVPDTDPDDAGIHVYGDFERVSRLFSVRHAPLRADRHGSIKYRKLISVPMPEGTNTPWLMLWRALKFPPWIASSSTSNPFEVLKMDRGYVVGYGTDCTMFISPPSAWAASGPNLDRGCEDRADATPSNPRP